MKMLLWLLAIILFLPYSYATECIDPPDCTSCNNAGGECWFSEVTANDGYGNSITYCTEALCVMPINLSTSLLNPVDGITIGDHSVTFNYSYTDFELPSGVSNCSLWLEESSAWNRNQTVDYPLAEIPHSFSLTFSGEGTTTYNWLVGCYDLESDQYNSTMWNVTINYDTSPPTVTLIAPVNNTNTASFTISSEFNSVNFVFNVTDLNAISNCSLFVNDLINETDFIITRDIDQTFTVILRDGVYNWTVKCSDVTDNQGIAGRFWLTLTTIFSKILSLIPDTPNVPYIQLNESLIFWGGA